MEQGLVIPNLKGRVYADNTAAVKSNGMGMQNGQGQGVKLPQYTLPASRGLFEQQSNVLRKCVLIKFCSAKKRDKDTIVNKIPPWCETECQYHDSLRVPRYFALVWCQYYRMSILQVDTAEAGKDNIFQASFTGVASVIMK